MVFNATFNNISVISWRSVLLVEETGEDLEKTTDLSQVTDKLYLLRISLKSNNTPEEHLSNSGDLTYRSCGEV
jgi:hypothetical protein